MMIARMLPRRAPRAGRGATISLLLWAAACQKGADGRHGDELAQPVPAAQASARAGDTDAASAATPTPAAPPTPAPPAPKREPMRLIAESEDLSAVEHHALEQKTVGFYAVFLPSDYAQRKQSYPLVVILHGSGSTELRHGALANDFGRQRAIYLAPRAPHPHDEVFMELDKPGWTAWPTYPKAWGEWDSPGFPTDELKKSADAKSLYVEWIADTIRDARRRYRVTSAPALIYGHSQGAGFAHTFALAHPEMVKAYFAFAGSFRDTAENPDDARHARVLTKHHITPWLAHNEADPVVNVDNTRKLATYFDRYAVPHVTLIVPGGDHYASSEIREAAKRFIATNGAADSTAAKAR
jgi:predicted esterase